MSNEELAEYTEREKTRKVLRLVNSLMEAASDLNEIVQKFDDVDIEVTVTNNAAPEWGNQNTINIDTECKDIIDYLRGRSVCDMVFRSCSFGVNE